MSSPISERRPSGYGWEKEDWEFLLYAIQAKQCTPFLGAGACSSVLPLGGQIATEWAQEYGYPFFDSRNLPRVAQYVAVHRGSNVPKFKLQSRFRDIAPPDYSRPNEPHRLMSDLWLPLYITTNYDNFMLKAIEASNANATSKAVRRPQSQICRWYSVNRPVKIGTSAPPLNPSPEEPLVFHLHGRIDSHESMVLTEDDYLDFLMYISDPTTELIPPCVEEAFASSSLLFLGYSLEDMDFKVLFRKLASYMRRAEGARHLSVQLAPQLSTSAEERERIEYRQRTYLERHFGLQKVKIFWGSCQDFAAELRLHLDAFRG